MRAFARALYPSSWRVNDGALSQPALDLDHSSGLIGQFVNVPHRTEFFGIAQELAELHRSLRGLHPLPGQLAGILHDRRPLDGIKGGATLRPNALIEVGVTMKRISA